MKIGFASLLTLIFITLKLTAVISWSWWWVISPIVFSLILIPIIAFGLAAFLVYMRELKE